MSKARSTLFPNGVSNATPLSFEGLANLRFDDPTKYHSFWDDFDRYNVTTGEDWTITATGAGVDDVADGDGGLLVLTNAAADNDSLFVQNRVETFFFEVGQELWWKCRFQVDDATLADVIMGLWIATATDPIDTPPTDGIFFRKDGGDDDIDFILRKDDAATEELAVGTLVDDVDIELAFHYDGVGTFEVYVDDSLVFEQTDLSDVPDDEVLTVGFGVQNSSAVARDMTVDYVLAVKER
jgi:hypothetical protein